MQRKPQADKAEPTPGTIYCGDCLDVMRGWPDGCIDCCVTSPPYWGLRDYGTAQWEGGDPECDHSPADTPLRRGVASSTLDGGKATTGHQHEGYRNICPRCGAVRIDQQLGLESTPEAYVASMVAVFEQVRRVLKPDGTCWLNLGDTYNANTGAGFNANKRLPARDRTTVMPQPPGTKPKDLIGIPWRVAFALQAAGWYLRSDIIWAKPNPMPESVTDRPTKSHEHVFLLSKSAKYWYDAAAIAEPLIYPNETRRPVGSKGAWQMDGRTQRENGGGAPYDGYPSARNARDVWTIATEPYPGAHFATFPTELPRRCILAGCPPGGIVLDPFMGSGTTGEVAERLGRRWVGIELNQQYIELARKRTAQRGLFVEVPAAEMESIND